MTEIATNAQVHPEAVIGSGVTIWDLSQVRERAAIGDLCVLGRNVYVGPGVEIGEKSKVQNNAQLFDPAEIGEGVFIGPGAILTNDRYPRAVRPNGSQKGAEDWEPQKILIERGASIGANATCVGPIVIGAWALVAAGSVVVNDVKAHSLVGGAPAKFLGWVGKAGFRLVQSGPTEFSCPKTGEIFDLVNDSLIARTSDEKTH